MSRETLEYHHDKHHATYVANLNSLQKGTEFERMGLEDIVRAASGAIYNNAAQVWNHSFFWNCLTPAGGGQAKGEERRNLPHCGSSRTRCVLWVRPGVEQPPFQIGSALPGPCSRDLPGVRAAARGARRCRGAGGALRATDRSATPPP